MRLTNAFKLKLCVLSLITLTALCLGIPSADELYANPRDASKDNRSDKGNEREILFKFKSSTAPTNSTNTEIFAFQQRTLARRAPRVTGLLKEHARSPVERVRKVFRGKQKWRKAKSKNSIVLDKDGFGRVVSAKLRPRKKATEVCEALLETGELEYCQPNYQMKVAALPNDTYIDPTNSGNWSVGAWGQTYPNMWGLKTSKATEAWNSPACPGGCKGQGVVIAVVDTGVDPTHPDLKGNLFINPGEIAGNNKDDDGNGYVDDVSGWDFTMNNNAPVEMFGHGTFVAGIAAARENNAMGIAGVAPSAQILTIKGLSDSGNGYIGRLAAGIEYAVELLDVDDDGKIDVPLVINNSWGGGCAPPEGCPSQPVVEPVIRSAVAKGAIVVFAAGNNYADAALSSPQNMEETITVGAVDQLGKTSSYTNYGPFVDFAAPGDNILSLFATPINGSSQMEGTVLIGTQYLLGSGTSAASPFVAGSAALLLSKNPRLTYRDVKAILSSSSSPITNPDPARRLGSGVINVKAAIDLANIPAVPTARATRSPTPLPTLPPTQTAATTPGNLPNDTFIDPDLNGSWSTSSWLQSYEDMWGVKMIEAYKAWLPGRCANGCQGQSSTIAVIDTGLDATHPDISSNVYVNTNEIAGNGIDDDNNGYIDDVSGWDFILNDNKPIDKDGNGTAVAGIIAASRNNSIGISGIAPRAKILPLKVYEESGYVVLDEGAGYGHIPIDYDMSSRVAEAIRYSVKLLDKNKDGKVDSPLILFINVHCDNNPANLLCFSSKTISDAIKEAVLAGAVPILPAGNWQVGTDGRDLYASPFNLEETIVVGSVDTQGKRSTSSNYGKWVDIAAPGGGKGPEQTSEHQNSNILTLLARNSIFEVFTHYPDFLNYPPDKLSPMLISDRYALYKGTSMAAAYVAGAAAVILDQRPTLTFGQLKSILQASADVITSPDPLKPIGAGIVNLNKALSVYTIPPTPTARPTDTPAGTPTHTATPTSIFTSTKTSTPTPTPIYTAPPGGWPALVVSNDYTRSLYYYDRSGAMIRQEPIPTPIGLANGLSGMFAHDLAMTADRSFITVSTTSNTSTTSNVYGTTRANFSILNLQTRAWSTIPLPSSLHDYVYRNDFRASKVLTYGRNVFMTLKQTSNQGAIVKLNLDTGKVTYVDSGYTTDAPNGKQYRDIAIANGELYVLYGNDNQQIRVFDVNTLEKRRSITFDPGSYIALGVFAVNSSGMIYGVNARTSAVSLMKFAPTGGTPLQKFYLPQVKYNQNFIDMNITSDGTIVLGSINGQIVFTDQNFTWLSSRDTGLKGPVFVTENFGDLLPPTHTPTATPTATRTATNTQTATRTHTASPTYTKTMTASPTATATRTNTLTPSPTATTTRTSTNTATATYTPTVTSTPTSAQNLKPWHNATLPQDVNNSGGFTPFDIMTINSELITTGPRQLPVPPPAPVTKFIDVSGDNVFSAYDILLVQNYTTDPTLTLPPNIQTTNLANVTLKAFTIGGIQQSVFAPGDKIIVRAYISPTTNYKLFSSYIDISTTPSAFSVDSIINGALITVPHADTTSSTSLVVSGGGMENSTAPVSGMSEVLLFSAILVANKEGNYTISSSMGSKAGFKETLFRDLNYVPTNSNINFGSVNVVVGTFLGCAEEE